MDDSVLFDDLGPSNAPPASVYDDMFDSYFNRAAEPPEPSPKASSSPSTPPPVFDKPLFDDDPDMADPFEAIPLFGGGVGGGGEDLLGSVGRAAKPERRESDAVGFDEDFIPAPGGNTTKSTEEPVREVEQDSQAVGLDDDLLSGFGASMNPARQMEPETVVLDEGVIPGFGGGTGHQDSAREEPIMGQGSEPISSSKMSVSMPEDPFVILGGSHKSGYSSFGLFSDHLDNNGMPVKVGNTKVEAPDDTGGMFQSSDIFTEFRKAIPSFTFTSENKSDTASHSDRVPQERSVQRASTKAHNNMPEVNIPGASAIHEVPSATGFEALNPFAGEDELLEVNQSSQMPNDFWITVSDIALVTQPTRAPPPSRPPPPLAAKKPPNESVSSETYILDHRNQGYHHSIGSTNASKTYQIDDLEDFFAAKPANFANGHPRVLNDDGKEQHSSAATASFMDWTEMGHSNGGNGGPFDSMFTSGQYRQPIDEKKEPRAYEMEAKDEKERLEHGQIQREHEENQRNAEREREEELEKEREKLRQTEQEERKRREKEREARQAVEKVVREARERAAAEARMQAEKQARQKAERAAVQKATAEARGRAAVGARERAAKAAVEAKEKEAAEAREKAAKIASEARERAAAESRERATKAAADARERAAKAAAEAREKAAAESQEKAVAEARAKAERAAVEKAAAEARRRAERVAFERVAAEARQRAASAARERAAAEARARGNQQRGTTEPDLESFFGMPSRSSSVPRSHTATTNPFDVQPQGNASSGAVRRTSSGSASPFTQPPPSNLADDLSSIFGAPSSSAVFQEVHGESEERRKARLERHQRTMERAAKALAEKNERDLQAQREQEERHCDFFSFQRIGESLDFEIKRWAAGKEGNLRALLSTLQYVLWPECGWRPISLTDLITAASVKKEYRKATLCIHPDKVQQKGANLQQKYIAEKVFDLLKEAWNKFNSEELF